MNCTSMRIYRVEAETDRLKNGTPLLHLTLYQHPPTGSNIPTVVDEISIFGRACDGHINVCFGKGRDELSFEAESEGIVRQLQADLFTDPAPAEVGHE